MIQRRQRERSCRGGKKWKLTTGAMFDFVILSAALPQMRYNMSSALKNMNMTFLGLAERRLPIT